MSTAMSSDANPIDRDQLAAALRRHPSVRDAAVVVSNGELIAYVVPSSETRGGDTTINAAVDAEQVAKWRKLSEMTYSRLAPATPPSQQNADAPKPDFNLAGWKSSYTGKPLPESEMAEWVDQTVQQMLALRPVSVLEIGCGLGLLLFRVAPHCREYWATDFFEGCVNFCRRHVDANPAFANVKLVHAEASEIGNVPQGHFDLIVINSVIQYFPSAAYLLDVLEKSTHALRPGGAVFLGDMRNLQLQEAFHLSVLLEQSRPKDTVETLRGNLRRRVEGDMELALAPGFFHAVRREVPQFGEVIIEPQRGHARNELTRFRFNAVLRISSPGQPPEPIDYQDWMQGGWTLDSLRHALTHDRPPRLAFAKVPNVRTCAAADAVTALQQADPGTSVADFRKSLAARAASAGSDSVDPQDLWDLEQTLPYRIQVSWANSDSTGDFDVAISRNDQPLPHIVARGETDADIARLASDPLRKRRTAALTSQLSDWLKTNLPEGSMPARMMVVDQLPKAGKH